MINKQTVRQELLRQRAVLSQKEVEEKGESIKRRLLAIVGWNKFSHLHIYSSVRAWNETDTKDIVSEIQNRTPKTVITLGSLDKDSPLPSQKFDLIIVPVLGFDSELYRLGLGGGWYDRFLATQPQATKVGLAYKAGFISDGLPHEPHDIPMDMIVTEEGIITNYADK